MPVHVEHGQLVRLPPGQAVHHVKGEVELVRVLEPDAFQRAVGPLVHLDELFPDPGRLGGLLRGGGALQLLLPGGEGLGLLLAAAQDDGVEHAVPAAGGHQAVGRGGVVVDDVAGVEDLDVLPHLDLQLAGEDDVALLALVGGALDGLQLGLLAVLGHHVQGLRHTVFEPGGHVVVGHAVGVLHVLALPRPGEGVVAQAGAGALHNVRHVHAEGLGAAVDEGEV